MEARSERKEHRLTHLPLLPSPIDRTSGWPDLPRNPRNRHTCHVPGFFSQERNGKRNNENEPSLLETSKRRTTCHGVLRVFTIRRVPVRVEKQNNRRRKRQETSRTFDVASQSLPRFTVRTRTGEKKRESERPRTSPEQRRTRCIAARCVPIAFEARSVTIHPVGSMFDNRGLRRGTGKKGERERGRGSEGGREG